MIVVCASESPRSAIISTRSRKLSLYRRYQRTQGGFKRSSQREHSVLCEPSVKCFGRCHPAESFPWSRIEGGGDSGEKSSVCKPRSVPFGKYWRSKPLVFSLAPGQRQCGTTRTKRDASEMTSA